MKFGGALIALVGGIVIYAATEDVVWVIALETVIAAILDS